MVQLSDATDICIRIAGVTHHADSAWLNGVKVWEKSASSVAITIRCGYTDNGNGTFTPYVYAASGTVRSDVTVTYSLTVQYTLSDGSARTSTSTGCIVIPSGASRAEDLPIIADAVISAYATSAAGEEGDDTEYRVS